MSVSMQYYILKLISLQNLKLADNNVLYILGIPDTSFNGRNTRTARSVRKFAKLLAPPPPANKVTNLAVGRDKQMNGSARVQHPTRCDDARTAPNEV